MLARPMKPRAIIRLAVAFIFTAWLAACSTAPQVPPPPAPDTSPAAPTTPAAALPDRANAPGDAEPLVRMPDDDFPRPALLGGEPAREFERGSASWYGPGFHGRRTASGERFDMHSLTAAHRTLPFGTLVRVHSLVNGREVDVRITDRGPYAGNRIIDLSRAAAEELGMLGLGFKQVVLLVPESTPAVAVSATLGAKKARRSVKRTQGLRAR